MIKTKKNDKCSGYLIIAADMVLLGLLAYFALTTVYSSDDYWYSTFWKDGLEGYLELMDYHYREFNGRTLVHVFVHLVLCFDNWAFALACGGLCMTAILAACHVTHVQKERIAAAIAIYLVGILVMPTSFFTDGMMWISAFFNYLFPVVLVCVLLTALEMRWPKIMLYAVTFLCGATTEQMGLTTVAITVAYTIDAAIHKKDFRRNLITVVISLVGVLTIFLSPATQKRVSNNMGEDCLESILADLLSSVSQEADLLTENPVPTMIMLGLLVMAGIQAWRKNPQWWYICVDIIGMVALLIGVFADGELRITGFILVFVALAVMATVLIMHEDRACGMLILAALASAAVLLPINTVAPRTMVPFYVLALLSFTVLMVKLDVKGRIGGVAVWAVAGMVVVALTPAIKGHWHNYQIDQLNKTFIEEDRDCGILRYCPDYDYDYTWVGKVHTNTYYQAFYLQANDVSEDTAFFFFSGDYDPPAIFCDEEQLNTYAAIHDQGEYYLPLRELIQHYGGTVEWSPEGTVVKMGEITFNLLIDGERATLRWTDLEGQQREDDYPCILYYGVTYCDQKLFENVIGLSVWFDKESNCFLLTS